MTKQIRKPNLIPCTNAETPMDNFYCDGSALQIKAEYARVMHQIEMIVSSVRGIVPQALNDKRDRLEEIMGSRGIGPND